MSSSISLTWSRCHVVARGGGWVQLAGVPESAVDKSVSRLAELGASSVSVVSPGIIQFRGDYHLRAHLVQVFPTCPLAS
jgi:hypothetical protein